MKTNLKVILTLFMAFFVQFTFAQEKTITGTVIDADSGMPLVGVNIVVQGTSTGALTDFDGKYSLEASTGQTLEFSYLGYANKTVTVGANTVVDVSLEKDKQALGEVVVVAYGAKSERSIVGSVASLGEEMLDEQQLTTVTEALQGTVAGVNIVTSGGQPGTNPTIRIRGIGSINASSEPLIIVDGAPFNGNINSISADQIKSMNVLKDAASAALYGSRASNGVIVITTKSGQYDSPTQISLSASTGFSSPAVDPHDVLGVRKYMQYSWEAIRNANQYVYGQDRATAGSNASNSLITSLGYNPYDIAQPVDANGNIVNGANLLWNTDWKDAMLRNAALRTQYSLGVSGGSEKTRFFLSANYLDQEGSVKTSNFKRITSRLNVDTKVTDWLTMGLNTSLSVSKQVFPEQEGNSYSSTMQWIYNVSSVYPLYERDIDGGLILDANGEPTYDFGGRSQLINGTRPLFGNANAVGGLYLYDEINKRTNVTANGYANIQFTDYLSFKTNLSYENYLFDYFGYASNEVGYAASVGGRVSQNRDIYTTLNFSNALTFDKDYGEHHLHADIIFEAYQHKVDELGAQGTGFLPGVKVLNGSTTPELVSGAVSEARLVSYLGRLAYNYKDRYYIEGSFRRDGSTRFSPDTRWGNFYAIGASWIISDEAFLEGNETLSFLKLRSSYGELGNNKILDSNGDPSFFPYLQVFETGYNQLENTGVILGGATDPFLTWETTALFNVGFDFGLFNDRIEGTIEYYTKESIDLIYDRPLPISTGNDAITTNVGSIKNTGIEFSLNAAIVKSEDFTLNAGFNLSTNKNEITELTQESFINGTKRWEVGKSLYDFYIKEWAGVDPADGYGRWYKDVLDPNGDPTGERELTKDFSEASKYYVGSSLPDLQGGFHTDILWGNFDFSALFSFSFGSQVYDYTYASLMGSFTSPGYQQSPDLIDRWQEPGDITDVPLLLQAQNDFNGTSTRFLFDNDYVRLRAITLGYTIANTITKSIGLNDIRIYVRGDNLFTWQSHFGIDPEQNISGTTNARSYLLKTISVGLNVKF